MTPKGIVDESVPTNKESKLYLYMAVIVLGSFLCTEIVNTFSVKEANSTGPSKIAVYTKIILEVVFLSFVIFRKLVPKSVMKLLCISAVIIGSSYLGSHIYLASNPDFSMGAWGGKIANQGVFASNVALFFANQCIFFFLCFGFFRVLLKSISHEKVKIIFMFYEFAIYLYAGSALLGLITGVEICRTYPHTLRWGYNGLLPYTNASSGFWLIAIFYSIIVATEEKRNLLLYISLFAMMLSGAKSLWLLSISIMIVYTWSFYSSKIKIKIGVAFSVAIAVAVMLSPYYMPEVRNKVGVIDDIIVALSNSGDILQILTSNRINLDSDSGRLIDVLDIFGSLTPINYLFGGLGGIVMVEMAFVDIPFAFGIVGTILLFYGYCLSFRKIKKPYKAMFATFYFATAFLIGWLINTPSLAPYLTIYVLRAEFQTLREE